MVVELSEGGEIFWSKMKQLEVEFYRVKIALANASGELKEEVSELFKTLKKVCKLFRSVWNNFWCSKVDLKMIGAEDGVDQVQGVPRGI